MKPEIKDKIMQKYYLEKKWNQSVNPEEVETDKKITRENILESKLLKCRLLKIPVKPSKPKNMLIQ
jgi:hypothetical protein